MKTCPFHYEVRFRLLSYIENQITPQLTIQSFSNLEPIFARNKAFEAFNEFLLYKKDELNLKDGNYYIKQSKYIVEKIGEIGKTISEKLEWRFAKFEEYREDIELYLVIDNHNESKILDIEEKYLLIHKVASYEFDPQELLDNLRKELEIYNQFNYETDNERIRIEHYGTDYFEGGEHPKLAFENILKTPFQWYSDKEKEVEEHRISQLINSEKIQDGITIEELIKGGETNNVEFKSSLLYNFKTKKAGAKIRYIIAKSICGFLNSKIGGLLFLGVKDDQFIQGLEYDFSLFDRNPKDQFLNTYDSLIQEYFSLSVIPFLRANFFEINGKEIFIIQIEKSSRPVCLNNQYANRKEFFVRLEASTREIKDVEEIIDYTFNNWEA